MSNQEDLIEEGLAMLLEAADKQIQVHALFEDGPNFPNEARRSLVRLRRRRQRIETELKMLPNVEERRHVAYRSDWWLDLRSAFEELDDRTRKPGLMSDSDMLNVVVRVLRHAKEVRSGN